VSEREAARAFVTAYLRRLVHLGGADALAAALPTSADAMVADGLAESAHVGPECWALTAEHGRVVLTWPDGHAEPLDLPAVPSADEAALHRAQHRAERLTADPHAPGGGGL